jgi:competence protein CoiA
MALIFGSRHADVNSVLYNYNMKYAIVNGKRVEATKDNSRGQCPLCGSDVIAHCGPLVVHHWKHYRKRNCDSWYENETEWHRSWKNNFPENWQEVIHDDKESGEKHIADIKTDSGWVIEFQNSYINPEERSARNSFYKPRLVWVVNGTRRDKDIPQFNKILKESTVMSNHPPLQIRRVHSPKECRLLREWHDNDARVFFDFQEVKEAKQTMLWFLFPKILNCEAAYISTFPRSYFIEAHNEDKFDDIVRDTISPLYKELEKLESRRNNY